VRDLYGKLWSLDNKGKQKGWHCFIRTCYNMFCRSSLLFVGQELAEPACRLHQGLKYQSAGAYSPERTTSLDPNFRARGLYVKSLILVVEKFQNKQYNSKDIIDKFYNNNRTQISSAFCFYQQTFRDFLLSIKFKCNEDFYVKQSNGLRALGH